MINLADPVAVLLAGAQALERANVEVAAYGGLALAIFGEPRETKDADLAVVGVTGTQAEAAFRSAGFDLILAFDRMKFGGQLVTRLTLFGGTAGSLNTVDLVEPRSERYGHEVLVRAIAVTLREKPLRVVSPEDFVVLKVLATRERDLEDATTVVRGLRNRLDIDLIERELQFLADEIADHKIIERWQRIRHQS